MMTDAQIKKLIDERIQRALASPNVIVRPQSIEALARRQAIEVMQPVRGYAQTTNATPTTVETFTVEEGEVGVFGIVMVATLTDGTLSAGMKRLAHYNKTGGALTIIGMWDVFNDDTAGVALLVDNDGSDNIKVEITGIAATDIDWLWEAKKEINLIATGV